MKRFKNILYVSGSESDEGTALARAAALARANDARLTALAVVEALPPRTRLPGIELTADRLQDALVDDSTRRLRQLIAAVDAGLGIEVKVVAGTPFLEVIREVLCNARDLVIKCAEASGMVGRLFGSDDMHLLRKCPCPVWLCKPNAGGRYRRILAAVDVEQYYPQGELETRQALNLMLLELAASLSKAESAELHQVDCSVLALKPAGFVSPVRCERRIM